jgi:hypothetical protein
MFHFSHACAPWIGIVYTAHVLLEAVDYNGPHCLHTTMMATVTLRTAFIPRRTCVINRCTAGVSFLGGAAYFAAAGVP